MTYVLLTFVITDLPLPPISSGDFGPLYRPRFHPLNSGTWYVSGAVFSFFFFWLQGKTVVCECLAGAFGDLVAPG